MNNRTTWQKQNNMKLKGGSELISVIVTDSNAEYITFNLITTYHWLMFHRNKVKKALKKSQGFDNIPITLIKNK